MHGKVLTYDTGKASGIVALPDGSRRNFSGLQLRGNAAKVSAGDEVDFQFENDDVREIYVVKPGNPFARADGVQIEKNRFVAAALAFFLGAFGAHKFYLGRSSAGVIMFAGTFLGVLMLGVPTLIVAVIAIVEAIVYATCDAARFEAKYVEGRVAWF